MTTPAIGTASPRTPQIAGYSISTSFVNPVITITPPATPTASVPTPAAYVVTNGVATAFDNPGMRAYNVAVQFIQAQGEAIQSAASNTAEAFGLNTTTAADQAMTYAQNAFQAALANVAAVNAQPVTAIIIPP